MTPSDPTRERLLEAAGQSFAQHGFEAATVRSICKQARVNLAAVNYYFRDKQRLYVEAVRRAHQCRMEDIPLPDWPAGTPAENRLRDFIGMLITRMLRRHPSDDGAAPAWHARLLLREMLQPTAACVELVREFIQPHFDGLMGILDELLPPDASRLQRHLIAFSIVGQCLHYRVAQPFVALLVSKEEFTGYSPETLAEHIAEFTLAALRSMQTLKSDAAPQHAASAEVPA